MSIADLYATDACLIEATETNQENDDLDESSAFGLAGLYQGHLGVDSEKELACRNLGGEYLVLLQYVFNFKLESGGKVCA